MILELTHLTRGSYICLVVVGTEDRNFMYIATVSCCTIVYPSDRCGFQKIRILFQIYHRFSWTRFFLLACISSVIQSIFLNLSVLAFQWSKLLGADIEEFEHDMKENKAEGKRLQCNK